MAPMAGSRHRFLEGRGPSQPPAKRHQHHFTAPTERTPSSASAGNGAHARLPPPVSGGLRSLAAAGATTSTPFRGADGADALHGLGQQW